MYLDGFGYKKVTLKVQGEDRRAHVHVLVAEAFHGPRPSRHQVRHFDGNRQNNRPKNLRYGTSKENHADTHRHGRRPYGECHGQAKLTSKQVSRIKALRGKHTCRELADMFGTSPANVCNIQLGRRWMHHKEGLKHA